MFSQGNKTTAKTVYEQSCSTSDPKRSWSVKIDKTENVTVKKTFARETMTSRNGMLLGEYETHHIKSNITCETFRVIHLIQCRLCNLKCIGETKRRLKHRFNEHKDDLYSTLLVITSILQFQNTFLPVIIPTIICFWFLLKNLKMGVILSGKHVKPTLSELLLGINKRDEL